jgi:hypothetical protein
MRDAKLNERTAPVPRPTFLLKPLPAAWVLQRSEIPVAERRTSQSARSNHRQMILPYVFRRPTPSFKVKPPFDPPRPTA